MPASFRGLALCAGAGGLELGVSIARPDYRTVAYVEREPAAIAILKARMRDGCLHRAPVHDDLRTFDGRRYRGRVGIVTAGYPCQPFSTNGNRRGFKDPRNLWPHVRRVAQQVRPEELFFENVAAHLTFGFPLVARDLRRMGCRFAAGVFAAGEVGPAQERKRLFILAYTDGLRPRRPGGHALREGLRGLAAHRRHGNAGQSSDGRSPLVVPDFAPGPLDFSAWRRLLAAHPGLEPTLGRDAPGMAGWLDRQRLAGNGVCSLAAAYAYTSLRAVLDGTPAPWLEGHPLAVAVGGPGQGPV